MDDADGVFLAIQTQEDQVIAALRSLARRLAAFNEELKKRGVSASLRGELVVALQESLTRTEEV